jgi:hypothetical protein
VDEIWFIGSFGGFFLSGEKKPNETERAGLYRYPVQTDRFFRSI